MKTVPTSHTMRSILAGICAAALVCSLLPVSGFTTRAYADEESVALLEQDAQMVDITDSSLNVEDAPMSSETTPEEALAAEHIPGELVVVYKKDLPSLNEELVLDEGGSITLEDASVVAQDALGDMPDDNQAALVTLEDDSPESMAEAIEMLSSVEEVAYVEPNYTYTTSNTVPNDPYATSAYQYYLEAAGITSMWDSAKAEDKVTVAVIDSGCNVEHPDLKDRINRNYAYDVISNKPLVSAGIANNGDSYGHGTNVCGIVASQANNSIGTAGTSWNATLLPVRIFTDNRQTDSVKLAAALQYLDSLIEKRQITNLRVINMSLGGDGNSSSVQSWLDHLYKVHGVLNVAAGGNGDQYGRPITSYTYPCDYNSCIGVTSTTKAGSNSSWCDYNNAKDLSAPGENIWTTTKEGSWAGYGVSGTSFSSPLVAGAAAAMFAKYPNASAYDVVRAMQQTAKSVSGQPTASGSAGALDAGSALTFLASHITRTNPSNGLGTVVNFAAQGVPMYRLYNRITGEHLYTASAYERDVLSRGDWNYEGIGWRAPKSGVPVYRLWNGNVGEHHYTTSAYERDYIVRYQGWTYEGIGWYSGGSMPLYRLYNPSWNMHHYTTSAYERDYISQYQGWNKEGIGWYGL